MATRVSARLTAADGRRFGLTVGGAFVALAALALWRHHPVTFAICATVGAALCAAGLALPARLGPLYRAWMGFAERLSRITTPILLGIVYFMVITPTGLVMQLFGRRPLRRGAGRDSYWVSRPTGSAAHADMQRQF